MDATDGSTALTLAVMVSFVLFAGGFWIIASLGQWALAPIDRCGAGGRRPAQFSLAEFLLLMLEAQGLFAAGLWWCDERTGWTSAAALLIGVSLTAAWWQGVQRLSRGGVVCRWRRGVFLLVVTPTACAAIIAALWINGRAVLEVCLGNHWPLAPWLTGNALIIGAFLICRLLTVWAMHDVTARRAYKSADEGIRYVSSSAARR